MAITKFFFKIKLMLTYNTKKKKLMITYPIYALLSDSDTNQNVLFGYHTLLLAIVVELRCPFVIKLFLIHTSTTK